MYNYSWDFFDRISIRSINRGIFIMKLIEFRMNGKPISFAKYFDSLYFNKNIVQFVPMFNGILLFLQKINRRLFLR